MNDLEFLLVVLVAALFLTVAVYFFLKMKGIIGTSKPPAQTLSIHKRPLPMDPASKTDHTVLQTLYRPNNSGVPTGTYRMFASNKGLIALEVDANNLPLPRKK